MRDMVLSVTAEFLRYRALAEQATRLGAACIAVGTVYEVEEALAAFPGDVVVLEPADPRDRAAHELWSTHDDTRIVRTVASEEAAHVDHSPERIARDALDTLGAEAGPARLDYPAYYGGLAVTVRTYLAARFGFNAHALSTRELERRMVSHGVDRWQARLVAGLLERCDDAVYAHRYPDFASADHDLTVAYEIVELSRPQASSDAEGQAALA